MKETVRMPWPRRTYSPAESSGMESPEGLLDEGGAR